MVAPAFGPDFRAEPLLSDQRPAMKNPKRRSARQRRITSAPPFTRLRCEALEPRLALAGDITTGLVHYWTFDETSGDIAHDSVGNADGTLMNWNASEAKWSPGRV